MITQPVPNTAVARPVPAAVTTQITQPVVQGVNVLGSKAVVQANAVEVEPLMEGKAAAKEPIMPVGVTLHADRVPSNWHILPTDTEGVVFAVNNVTGKSFTGPTKKLSEYMRTYEVPKAAAVDAIKV
jgi:hypothetical protein